MQMSFSSLFALISMMALCSYRAFAYILTKKISLMTRSFKLRLSRFAHQTSFRHFSNSSNCSLPAGFTVNTNADLKQRPASIKVPILVSGSALLHRIIGIDNQNYFNAEIDHLKELIHEGYRVQDIDVRGDTRRPLDINHDLMHPVVASYPWIRVSCLHA
jgi:hypothetical protein